MLEAVIEISFSDHSQKRRRTVESRYKKNMGPSIFPLQVMKGGFRLVGSRHPSACQSSFQLKFSCHLQAWNTRLTVRNRQISSLTCSPNPSTVMLAGAFCFLCTAAQQQIVGNRSVIRSEERNWRVTSHELAFHPRVVEDLRFLFCRRRSSLF